jgi:RNA polymerase sigma-70 factor (ECF subfamily)
MYLSSEVLPVEESLEGRGVVSVGLDELDSVFSFLFARVGNRSDAEDLTQEVALKALPRLREDAPRLAVRAYLFATARSSLAAFWSRRLRLPESELHDDVAGWAATATATTTAEPSAESAEEAARVLGRLSPQHRRVLELRFLHGYSLREVAAEMGKSVGSVKVMQLRALRKAAATRTPAHGTGSRSMSEPSLKAGALMTRYVQSPVNS